MEWRGEGRETEKKVATRVERRLSNGVVRIRESVVRYRIIKLRSKIRQSEWHILRAAGTYPRTDSIELLRFETQ